MSDCRCVTTSTVAAVLIFLQFLVCQMLCLLRNKYYVQRGLYCRVLVLVVFCARQRPASRLSHGCMDQSITAEVRILQFSHHSSFAG